MSYKYYSYELIFGSLQLCIAVQVPECLGGLEAQAVFIDTDFGFTVSRLRGKFIL